MAIQTFTNTDYGITARIAVSHHAKHPGWIVSLKDDDSGEVCGTFKIFPNHDDAIAFAKSLVA